MNSNSDKASQQQADKTSSFLFDRVKWFNPFFGKQYYKASHHLKLHKITSILGLFFLKRIHINVHSYHTQTHTFTKIFTKVIYKEENRNKCPLKRRMTKPKCINLVEISTLHIIAYIYFLTSYLKVQTQEICVTLQIFF